MRNFAALFGLIAAFVCLQNFAAAASPKLASTATPTTPVARTLTATPRLSPPNSALTPGITATLTPTTPAAQTGTASITATHRLTATGGVTLTAPMTPTLILSPTATLIITPTQSPTLSMTATLTRLPLTVDANAISIGALRARSYGGSGVKITRVIYTGDAYQQVLFEYPSDGLRITGIMHIPRGIGPFPVVVLDHGYFKPAEYKTNDGTSRAADSFARHGYLTLAPDYRCYAGSQCGANPFYIGFAVDVLNLLAQIPSVPDADPARIGIWGHSMGGQVTLRALAINDSIKVAALYGALTGDDEVHYCWLRGCRAPTVPTREPRAVARLQEMDPDFLSLIPAPAVSNEPVSPYRDLFFTTSPVRYLGNIDAAMIVHHGEADDVVPIQWSVDLVNALSAQGRTAVLYTYSGEGHVFAGWGWQLFMTRTLNFFDQYLNPRQAPITAEKRVLRQERTALEASY